MAGTSLSVESLSFCTGYLANLLNNECEYFLFFGSLLGYVRDGSPISMDDDVDFYVSARYSSLVRKIIAANNFEVVIDGKIKNKDFFLQVHKKIGKHHLRADFYFYYELDHDYIIDCWNFHAQPEVKDRWLKVPIPLIRPVRTVNYCGARVCLPKHSKILCEFLYGQSWEEKKKKGQDYKTLVLGGRPIHFQKSSDSLRILP